MTFTFQCCASSAVTRFETRPAAVFQAHVFSFVSSFTIDLFGRNDQITPREVLSLLAAVSWWGMHLDSFYFKIEIGQKKGLHGRRVAS